MRAFVASAATPSVPSRTSMLRFAVLWKTVTRIFEIEFYAKMYDIKAKFKEDFPLFSSGQRDVDRAKQRAEEWREKLKGVTEEAAGDFDDLFKSFGEGFETSDATSELASNMLKLLDQANALPSVGDSFKKMFDTSITAPVKKGTDEIRKFDAATSGSLDSIIRYQLYLDRLEGGPGKKGHGGASGGGGTAAGSSPLFNPSPTSSPASGSSSTPAPDTSSKRSVELLTDIRDGINELVEAKKLEFEAAGLGGA